MNKVFIAYYTKNVYGTNLEYIHSACTGAQSIIEQLTGKRTITPQIRSLIHDLSLGSIIFIHVKEQDTIEAVKITLTEALKVTTETSEENDHDTILLNHLLANKEFTEQVEEIFRTQINTDAVSKDIIDALLPKLIESLNTNEQFLNQLIKQLEHRIIGNINNCSFKLTPL